MTTVQMGEYPVPVFKPKWFVETTATTVSTDYHAERIADEAERRLLAMRHVVNGLGEVRGEIVRCRDCRFSLAHGNGCGRNQDIYDAEPDGFCAWGERRQSDER